MSDGMGPCSCLNADPLPWLLEREHPSVRYWTLVDILQYPPNDALVLEMQSEIMQSSQVQSIFSQQKPDGSWGRDATRPFNADGTLVTLNILKILGVPSDGQTQAGIRVFLRYSQSKDGGFSYEKCRPSGVFPCSTGENLPLLSYFGWADEPEFKQAGNFMLQAADMPDTFVCSRYQKQTCLWAAIALLKGLAALPQEMCSSQTQSLVDNTADVLLSAEYDFSGEHRRWLTLGVPRAWDLLSALLALAMHGYSTDERFLVLFDRFLSLQNENGCWVCDSISRTWPLEKRGKPSKWITLDALRLLKQMRRYEPIHVSLH